MARNSTSNVGKVVKVNRPSYKKQVLAVFPNAILLIDTQCNKNAYVSDWADASKYAIGVLPKVKNKPIIKTTYTKIVAIRGLGFLAGWNKTSANAWKEAWKNIEKSMMEKLEE